MEFIQARNRMPAPLKEAENLRLIEWTETLTFSVSG